MRSGWVAKRNQGGAGGQAAAGDIRVATHPGLIGSPTPEFGTQARELRGKSRKHPRRLRHSVRHFAQVMKRVAKGHLKLSQALDGE